MGQAIVRTYTESFDEMHCGGCGIVFYVPQQWHEKKRDANGSFSCPNGCTRRYVGETEADRALRLSRELDAATSAKAFAERRLADEQVRHQKELKRIAKRASAGVCPCCKRTVSQMTRHMKTKHPDFNKC